MSSKWEDKKEWLFKHSKDTPSQIYNNFINDFPDFPVTKTALLNARSRAGASAIKKPHTKGTGCRPLYFESIKADYVMIKVAHPNVWWTKSKWVWVETHPWLYNEVKETDSFIFLDGNRRNFSPANIEKVSQKELGVLNRVYGGIIKGAPEKNKLQLARIRLRLATLDAGEKLGMVKNYGSGRVFKEKLAEQTRTYYRKHRDDPEFMEKVRTRQRNYKKRWTPEQKERERIRQRAWYKKQQEKKKNEQNQK